MSLHANIGESMRDVAYGAEVSRHAKVNLDRTQPIRCEIRAEHSLTRCMGDLA